MKLDHLVWVAGSLDDAVRDHEGAGFDVQPGGRHAGLPTRNALARLGRGVYLELLTGTSPWIRPTLRAVWGTPLRWGLVAGRKSGLRRRFLGLVVEGKGLCDLCLASGESLDRVVARARAAGVELSDPIRMSRTRPDGVRLEWRLAVPRDPVLPFFIEDETDRELRLPPPSPPPRGGRFAGVRAVRMGAPDPAATARELAVLLDREPIAGTEPSFRLGDVDLVVHSDDGGRAHRVEAELVVGDGAPVAAPALPRGYVLAR